MEARWNGAVIARSDNIDTVDGNAYFPAEALLWQPGAPPPSPPPLAGFGSRASAWASARA